MAHFASRFVGGRIPRSVAYSTDTRRQDVYSYNFPNDRRSVKFLGESSNGFKVLVMSWRASTSLFRVHTGDRPNSADWGRRPLLVSYWIWRCGTPQEFSLRPHRHRYHRRHHFVDRSRILLLSDLDAEPEVLVLLANRCRMRTLFPHALQLLDVLNIDCYFPIDWGGMGGFQGKFSTPFAKTHYLPRNSVTRGRKVRGFQGGSICTHTRFASWSTCYLTRRRTSYGRCRVPWRTS
jgi:hypothetical protein